ncbi:hypothetical protein BaRGS_00008249, partial [Batillaria attramentaria]
SGRDDLNPRLQSRQCLQSRTRIQVVRVVCDPASGHRLQVAVLSLDRNPFSEPWTRLTDHLLEEKGPTLRAEQCSIFLSIVQQQECACYFKKAELINLPPTPLPCHGKSSQHRYTHRRTLAREGASALADCRTIVFPPATVSDSSSVLLPLPPRPPSPSTSPLPPPPSPPPVPFVFSILRPISYHLLFSSFRSLSGKRRVCVSAAASVLERHWGADKERRLIVAIGPYCPGKVASSFFAGVIPSPARYCLLIDTHSTQRLSYQRRHPTRTRVVSQTW